MATISTVTNNDYAADVVQKVNTNCSNLNSAIEQGGSGGGGTTPSGIIALNEDAVARIAAAKQHFDLTINAYNSWVGGSQANCFCIAHGSDFHTDEDRYKRFRDFVDGVDLIDAAIVTGDITDQGSSTEMTTMLGVTFSRIQPMQSIGNHERWGGLTIAQIASGLGMKHNNNTDAAGGYYYKDFATPKIRVIVLNEFDIASTNRSTAGKVCHWSQAQINWLLDVLDDAITNNYNVIVAMHSIEQGSASKAMPASNDKGFYQRSNQWEKTYTQGNAMSYYIIEDIIAAFKTGGTVTGPSSGSYPHNDGTTAVSVNHTFSAAGKFIAYMIGHAHIDMTGYSTQHSEQLYLCCPAGCVVGGDNRFFGGEVSDLPRIIGTKSEDCFNVYGFDLINKVVKIVRVGADMNDLMEPREVAYFDYEPSVS